MESRQEQNNKTTISPSILLIIGIFFLPYIFSWFTLNEKYSSLTKLLSFSWTFILLVIFFSFNQDSNPNSTINKPDAMNTPVNNKNQSNKINSNSSIKNKYGNQATEKNCKIDLTCWAEKNDIEATVQCQKYVPKLAKYDYEWTDGMFEVKFSHYKWKNKRNGVITYIGDKIKFQNGFGAWQNYIYECDFNPHTKQVLDVRGQPGRI
ncbi:hypothetical protein [Kangiella sp. TOML190]|uniref:hypothetical protein n=1 Tax=Kangiella sp. TOML190 TaxID=2931351 RepID=UPI00203FF3BF|nr:hypothetical protein [Kangiella sp. TOML190]